MLIDIKGVQVHFDGLHLVGNLRNGLAFFDERLTKLFLFDESFLVLSQSHFGFFLMNDFLSFVFACKVV